MGAASTEPGHRVVERLSESDTWDRFRPGARRESSVRAQGAIWRHHSRANLVVITETDADRAPAAAEARLAAAAQHRLISAGADGR